MLQYLPRRHRFFRQVVVAAQHAGSCTVNYFNGWKTRENDKLTYENEGEGVRSPLHDSDRPSPRYTSWTSGIVTSQAGRAMVAPSYRLAQQSCRPRTVLTVNTFISSRKEHMPCSGCEKQSIAKRANHRRHGSGHRVQRSHSSLKFGLVVGRCLLCVTA